MFNRFLLIVVIIFLMTGCDTGIEAPKKVTININSNEINSVVKSTIDYINTNVKIDTATQTITIKDDQSDKNITISKRAKYQKNHAKSLKDRILELARSDIESRKSSLEEDDELESQDDEVEDKKVDDVLNQTDDIDDIAQILIQNQDVRSAKMAQESHLVSNLVKKITAWSVKSGEWSDPKTWKNGVVPGDGARVLIGKDHQVVVSKEINTHYRTIKVEGELAFNPHKNTKIYVDTMVTTRGSILRIGEPQHPIDEDKRAQIIISDYNAKGISTDPKSIDYDPLKIGQGLLSSGLFVAHGSNKTPYITIQDRGVKKRTKEIRVDEVPKGWKVGDSIVILGTSENGTQSEERKIVSIDDDTIKIDRALEFDHLTPETTLQDSRIKVHIANLTRNVIIKSDPALLNNGDEKNSKSDLEHRGHILFLHNNNVNLSYVQFENLGRTDKKAPLDETIFESDDKDAKAKYIGKNPSDRYSLNFHRAGVGSQVGNINGCVVLDSPSWGYVNHSSNVRMVKNIAYHIYGASFVTEAGDENGLFLANMAIETKGSGRSSIKEWAKRFKIADGGSQGNGFWILGSHVDFIDNIVNGSSNSAFAFIQSTTDDVTGVIYSEDESEHDYSTVAVKSFIGNIAYGNSGGVLGFLNIAGSKTTEKISNLLAWGNASMSSGELISCWKLENIIMENITLIGDLDNPKYIGIKVQTKNQKAILKNIKTEGFEININMPDGRKNMVENQYQNDKINI